MEDHTPTPYFPDNLQNCAPWVTKHGLLYTYGKCQCGCGDDAPVAKMTEWKYGVKAGHPKRFLQNHHTYKPSLREYKGWQEIFGLVEPYGMCQCGCGQVAAIAKRTNRRLGQTKGEPSRFALGHDDRRQSTLEERFWANVNIRGFDECWLWQGTRTDTSDTGYGLLGIDYDQKRAHRVSWELHNGPIPDGLFVCHKCDNPPCCNPYHLFLGTHQDNMDDMEHKGRHKTTKGTQRHNAKLTEDIVKTIRKMHDQGTPKRELAQQFDVHTSTIREIVHHRKWKHVP